MSIDQSLARQNSRLRKALKFLIKKVHATAKEIEAEVKVSGTSQASKRVADHAAKLESAAITAETVFQPKP